MTWKWPWDKDEEKSARIDGVAEDDRETLRRELEQVKLINRHVLARAVARGWIDEDVAESIRGIQMDEENGGTAGGAGSPKD